jgi:hypothetical protein
VSFHPFHSRMIDACAWFWKYGLTLARSRHSRGGGVLHIHVQAIIQLRSRRRVQEAEKNRCLTSLLSVARSPDVGKVRFRLARRHSGLIPWQTTRRQSTSALRNYPAPSKMPKRHLLPSVDDVPNRGLLYPLVFRMKYVSSTGWSGSGMSWGSPLWKSTSTASRGRFHIGWMNEGMNSGSVRSNPWTVKTSHYVRWKGEWC